MQNLLSDKTLNNTGSIVERMEILKGCKKSFFKKENFSQSKSKKSEIKFHNFGKGSLNFSKKEVHAAASEAKLYFALTYN